MDNLKIKNMAEMTLSELSQVNRKLGLENEIERMILQSKRRSGEIKKGEKNPLINTRTLLKDLYQQPDIDLENKTIGEMTIQELESINERLYLESSLRDKILDLKRNSGEDFTWGDEPDISRNMPIEQLYHDAISTHYGMDLETYLSHYGILGMKWGVRKDRNSGGRRRAKSNNEQAEEKPKSGDYMESRILKSKGSSGLSNSELRQLNERLNLERQYKDLTKAETAKGKNFLSNGVSSGLQQTASTVVAASSLYAVKKLIERYMGASAAAEMFPPPKKK